MDTKPLIRFLRYLAQTASGLLQKSDATMDEIVSLRRDCDRLVQQIDGTDAISGPILASIHERRFDLDETPFSGGRRHFWSFLFTTLIGGPLASEHNRAVRTQRMRKIQDFRNGVDHLLFAIDVCAHRAEPEATDTPARAPKI